MLSPGDKVRDCEVIAPLGSGGMATLYLARRRGVGGFSRLVTLKLVHQHLVEDESIIELFLDEARICAHVAHPNVVHVEEVGEYGGSYFIAMEYVHGVSLAELLARLTERRLRLRPKLCVWLAAQIAEALHAAHEAKGENGTPLDIVHRDVSPQNVLIAHTGHVKLIDFGIAESKAENEQHGSGQPVRGKLRYMAPEQLRLERADRRTDVYALGVMLWEMLAGRSLFRCQKLDDERDWALREDPPPPSKFSSQSTPSLDRVVLKAIASEPTERFQSAFQLRTALLRADPAAVKLDAPMVASLLRSMLGDELDRKRASWPSEVSGELGEVKTSQTYPIEDLTAALGIAMLGGSREDDDDDDDPTQAIRTARPSRRERTDALDSARADLRIGLASAKVSYVPLEGLRVAAPPPSPPGPGFTLPPREKTLLGMPKAPGAPAIDTLKCPPVTVAPLVTLRQPSTLRAVVVGSVCLTVGVYLGTLVSSSSRQESTRAATAHAKSSPRDEVKFVPAAPAPPPAPLAPTAAPAAAPAAFIPTEPAPSLLLAAPDAGPDGTLESEPVCAVVDCNAAKLLTAIDTSSARVRERYADAGTTRSSRAARKESRWNGSRRASFRASKQAKGWSSKSSSNRKQKAWLVRTGN
jgi:serine/threonine protein kinase